MTKQDIMETLKETDGKIIYTEQFIKILTDIGYTFEESNIIRKIYGKRQIDKIKNFELQLRNTIGDKLAEFLISKIVEDTGFMYWRWKCHEDAWKACTATL